MKYSQREEQDYILRLVEGMPPSKFLDIGAYDGVQFSNTMALIERGWSGVMVEPGLEAFQALLKNHGGNPRITLIHAAVATDRGLAKFWNNSTTYSTMDEATHHKWSHVERFSPHYFVPTIATDDLGRWLSGVQVLSIDTEGSSVDLLLDFPMDICRPKVVCVEHDDRLEELYIWASENKYQAVVANVENLIFAREDA